MHVVRKKREREKVHNRPERLSEHIILSKITLFCRLGRLFVQWDGRQDAQHWFLVWQVGQWVKREGLVPAAHAALSHTRSLNVHTTRFSSLTPSRNCPVALERRSVRDAIELNRARELSFPCFFLSICRFLIEKKLSMRKLARKINQTTQSWYPFALWELNSLIILV